MAFDSQLIARLQAGDVAALEACYHEHGRSVFVLCRHLLGNEADARDATQEVFIKLFERAASFAGRASFLTWLRRLAVNHCLSRLEHERLRQTAPLDEEQHATNGSCPSLHAQGLEQRALLDGWLERLPNEQRAVLVLREIEGLSYDEIAATLAVPSGTVMSRLARARERLWMLSQRARSERDVPERRVSSQ